MTPTIDRDVAYRVLTFLEDRRAIYEVQGRAVWEHVVASILEIRQFLTDRRPRRAAEGSISGRGTPRRLAALRRVVGEQVALIAVRSSAVRATDWWMPASIRIGRTRGGDGGYVGWIRIR
ncbi:hypothetical protein Vau01_121410 [Virgisporangium aurantiacum]|uniref:Uncharacterized protein n=1 Tax=Virgisporangium aurantiacum TaxID=175570 RepID=A0A8J3ZNE5_9ACTN|nr:hypothetical protein Vau01_121410 [Virgisporangium aurantiacum]